MINLGMIFTAKDMASGAMSRLEGNFLKLDKTIQGVDRNFTKHVTAFTAGIGLMAAGAKAASIPLSFVDSAGKFESSVAKMVSLTDFGGKELEKMKQIALTVGPKMGVMADQVILGMENLGTAGLNARQTLEAIQPVLMFSGASQGALNLEKAGITFMAATNAFGLGTKNAQRTVDMLTKTTAIGTLGFEDLERVIASAGSTANGTGQKFSTFLASISAIKAQGGTAMDASEKFRMALNTLQAASSITEKALGKMGMKLTDLRDVKTGAFLQMPDLLDKIKNGLNTVKGSTEAATKVLKDKLLGDVLGIGGIQAYNKINALRFEVERNGKTVILSGTQALREQIRILEKAGASGTTAAKANETFQASYNGLILKITALGDAIKIRLGQPLLSAVNKGLGQIADQILFPFLNALGKSPQLAQAVTFGLLGLGAALMTIGAAIAGFAGFAMINAAMVTAGITIGGTLTAIGSAIATAFLPVLGIAAVIAAGVAMWQTNFGGFRDWLINLWSSLSSSVGNVVSGLVGQVSTFFSSFAEGFDFTSAFSQIEPVFQVILEVINELGSAIQSTFADMSLFSGAISGDGMAQAASSGSMLGSALSNILVPALRLMGTMAIGVIKVITLIVNVFNMLGSTGRNIALLALSIFAPWIAIPLLIANNWGLISTTFNALVGVVSLVGAAIKGVFDGIVNGSGSFFTGLAVGIGEFVGAVVPVLMALPGQLLTAMIEVGTGILDLFANVAVNGQNATVRIIASFFLMGASIIGAVIGAVGNMVGTLLTLPGHAGGVVGGIGNAFNRLISWLGEIGSAAVNALKAPFAGIGNWIKSMLPTGGITIPIRTTMSGPMPSARTMGGGAPKPTPHSRGGVIPMGYPNDSYAALLTSGERVLTPRENRDYESMMAVSRDQPFKSQGSTGGTAVATKAPPLIQTVRETVIERDTSAQTGTQSTMTLPPIMVTVMLDGRELFDAMAKYGDDREGREFVW